MPETTLQTRSPSDAEPRGGYLSPHEVILGAAPADKPPTASTVACQTAGRICYDTRHLLPSFVLGVGATLAAVVVLAWANAHCSEPWRALAASSVWASVAALWTFLLFRWAYRALFWRVDVNDQEVVYRRGWLWPKCTIPLVELARAEVWQSWWHRWLGFGHIRLIFEKPDRAPVVLLGVPEPHSVAEQLTRSLQQARQAQVSQARFALADSDPSQTLVG